MRRIIRLGYNYNSELCGILDTYLKNVVLVGNLVCFFACGTEPDSPSGK